MQVATSAVLCLKRSTWSDPNKPGRDPITWASGALVEYGTFFDEETGSQFDATLAEDIGPEIQPRVVVQLQMHTTVEARDRGHAKWKNRVIAAKVVDEVVNASQATRAKSAA